PGFRFTQPQKLFSPQPKAKPAPDPATGLPAPAVEPGAAEGFVNGRRPDDAKRAGALLGDIPAEPTPVPLVVQDASNIRFESGGIPKSAENKQLAQRAKVVSEEKHEWFALNPTPRPAAQPTEGKDAKPQNTDGTAAFTV